ncbi:MAG: GerMN domain-containing protein [Bacillota bacterium]|nr:GerMN domain-containing protein [Bacillota bacterium]
MDVRHRKGGWRRAGRRLGSALLLALLLLGAGCGQGVGVGSGTGAGTGPAPGGASQGAPPSRKGPAPEGEPALAVYFVHGSGGGRQRPVLAPVRRPLPEGVRPDDVHARLRAAMEALLSGPTEEERRAGWASALPRGTRLLGVEVARPVAVLDFSGELEQAGGTLAVGTLLDQIALTAASVQGVKGVELRVEGARVGSEEHPFTGEGFLFRRLLPPLDSELVRGLAPEEALDLWIAAIPDREAMWRLMGPGLRARYGKPAAVDVTAWAEGLGSYRGYTAEAGRPVGGDAKTGEGQRAEVRLQGTFQLEGMTENVVYTARMVREGGIWRFDGGQKAE